ncbi:MAG: hypothetical protein MJZ29_04130 [Bacteroidaceae bacterium]|nr:hypothetical protein [Bacteroidaceae bacterium]
MKKLSLIIIALVFVCTGSSAQTYKVTLPATPTIVDLFLAAAKYDKCETELVRKYAANSVKAQKLDRNTKRIIDKKNGYLEVTIGSNEDYHAVESCYWKMNNGNLLIAITHQEYQETTTLHFYEYNKASKTLKVVEKPFSLGLGGKAAEVHYELPRYGKTIVAETYDLMTDNGNPYRWKITWNGSKFDVKHVY